MSRFVVPETDTLTLANGDTLTVWRRLNAGQANRRRTRLYMTASDGTRIVNFDEVNRTGIIAYLIDWKLAGDDVPIRGLPAEELAAVLDRLDPPSLLEIRDAIDAHEMRQTAARDAEKKTQTGAPVLSPTSTSPADAAGGTNG